MVIAIPSVNKVEMQAALIIREFQQKIAEYTEFHAGYPYNLAYDYTQLWPFLQYTLNNLGDPFVNGNYGIHTREFEQQCLYWFAQLYELNEHWGYVTSSGTEGNLYGLFLGRELYPDAVLYSSQDTHYSVAKAARFFRIPHVIINSQPNGEIDYQHLEQELFKRQHLSAIVNVNLGTTMRGAVDKIDQTVAILEKLNISFHLHCDGALGGLLLPFIEAAPKISFKDYPIGSIAVSGHKFIGSPIPCGVVLTRQEYVKKIETTIDYIGSIDTTIMGSRNGLAPLILWYAITTRGEHFEQEVSDCLHNAMYLYKQLGQIGFNPLINAFSTTVVFKKPGEQVCRKWHLATQSDLAHIVVMQNLSPQKIDLFINDLLTESNN